MGHPARKNATYQDLLSVPPHLTAEIIGGTLHTQPRPTSRHALASSSVGGELFGPFHRGKGGPGGWIILDEPELHLGHDVLVPDLAGWRRERMPEVPEAPFFELAPDWVCEVLSPSTEKIDRADKIPIYLRERYSHLWLVQPLTQTLEIYRLDGATFRLTGTFKDDAQILAEPFDALPFDLGSLWAR